MEAGVNRGKAPGPTPLAPEAIEATSMRLRVIADPVRLALLEALRGGEGSVADLAEQTGLPHQNASHHLLALHQAGILARRREGKLALYSILDWSAWWVVEQLARSVDPL
jgi:DNA-binding transcriptional ArsR family regulator